MKVFKVEMYVVDFEGMGEEEIKRVIEDGKYIYPNVVHMESREVNWSDDHPLNKKSTCDAEYKRLFST